MIGEVVVKTLVYFLWLPMVMSLFMALGKLLKMKAQRALRMKPQRNVEPKQSLAKKLWAGVKFEMKGDKRPVSDKITLSRTKSFYMIILSGYLLSLASLFAGFLFPISLVFPLFATVFAYRTSKGLMAEQENIMRRVYETKRDIMGLVSDQRNGMDYDAEFTISDWNEDHTQFDKILLHIPTSFDELRATSVTEKFTQNFGGGTAWVTDTKTDVGGWDYVRGLATLRRTAALPSMAKWDEHYVLNDNIAWSYFPIGLGTENGVELVNPETGETEHVLGFDVQGMEGKLGAKKGFNVGPEIVAAPQILVSGGTGGGKSLAETTTLPTVIED